MFEDTFMNARAFLGRVRELNHQLEVTRRRLEYRSELGEDTGEVEEWIRNLEQSILEWKRNVMEALTVLPTAEQAAVIMKRYVDLMTWDEIAADMDIGVREVQKLHGKALPILDVKIEYEEEPDGI